MVGTTLAPHSLGSFSEKAGERNLYFLSAPAFDVTGSSVTAHVIPASLDGRSILVPPSGFKPETAVQLVHLPAPSVRLQVDEKGELFENAATPLFFSMPSPQEMAEFVAMKRLKQTRVPERYTESTYKFPESLFAFIPQPVVEKPKPVETPAYVAPRTNYQTTYKTTKFYLLNTNSTNLKVYVEYQDGSGRWQKGSVTVGAGQNLYIGQVAEGTQYYTEADGYTGSWEDVGHDKAWVRMKF